MDSWAPLLLCSISGLMIDCWHRVKLEMLFAVIVLLNTCTVFIAKVRSPRFLHPEHNITCLYTSLYRQFAALSFGNGCSFVCHLMKNINGGDFSRCLSPLQLTLKSGHF